MAWARVLTRGHGVGVLLIYDLCIVICFCRETEAAAVSLSHTPAKITPTRSLHHPKHAEPSTTQTRARQPANTHTLKLKCTSLFFKLHLSVCLTGQSESSSVVELEKDEGKEVTLSSSCKTDLVQQFFAFFFLERSLASLSNCTFKVPWEECREQKRLQVHLKWRRLTFTHYN